jgi:hypothetical protein
MSKFPKRNPRLQDRDYPVLEHVRRYRITTPEVLHLMPEFADLERNAIMKVTSRLCDHEFLLSHPLYKSFTYFTLGRNGARVMGLETRHVGPLGPHALYRDYGVLAFCCLSPTRRERLRGSELEKEFPECWVKGRNVGIYFRDHHNSADLPGYIWVEAGGTTDHIFDVVSKNILDNKRQYPGLRKRIDEGAFALTVITYLEEKRNSIEMALARIKFPIYIRVEVIPELIHLLPSI